MKEVDELVLKYHGGLSGEAQRWSEPWTVAQEDVRPAGMGIFFKEAKDITGSANYLQSA